MSFRKMSVVGVVSLALAPVALAYDFAPANALFAQREQGAQQIAQARAAYVTALPSVSGAERIFAGEQIARLDYYEGIKTPEAESDARKAIFTRCMNALDENLAVAKVGSNVQYFYWKGSCLANWGKASGPTSPASLARVPELLGLIKDGLAISDKYEGGGFYRLSSAVYLKIPAIFGGGAEKAEDFADKALRAESYPGSVDPDTATGDYFYNAYEFKCEAMSKRGKKDEAVALLKAAIKRIDDGDLPLGREPETRVFRADLQATLGRIQ